MNSSTVLMAPFRDSSGASWNMGLHNSPLAGIQRRLGFSDLRHLLPFILPPLSRQWLHRACPERYQHGRGGIFGIRLWSEAENQRLPSGAEEGLGGAAGCCGGL
ncbi:hypothetical protein LshimejAT787_1700880 [Lyophyllum shimeji]|uniref:Uncharacterized protein n=1 Tax=Lyophyllum shimeji TaxID=47721 RepID=A0A9P3Q0F8_LYOSH|nr:hypothetical protein LshimejAT787_1700880 [Lyophyllum shimeji]